MPEQLLRQAVHAEVDEDPHAALRFAAEALRRAPEHAGARLHTALNLAALAREEADTRYGWQRAEAALEALRATARALGRSGVPLGALAAASHALALAPDDAETLELLAALHAGAPPRDDTAPPRTGSGLESLLDEDDDDALVEAAHALAAQGPARAAGLVRGGAELLLSLAAPDFLDAARALRCLRWAPGAEVIREGDRDDAVFLIVEGRARVHRESPQGPRTLALLGPGAVVGEMAWLHGRVRSATVTATGPGLALRLDGATLDSVDREGRRLRPALQRAARQRLIANLLATAPMFEPLSPEDRRRLVADFVPRSAPRGSKLIEEGAPPEGLWIVLRGRVRIARRRHGPIGERLAELGDGEVIGEIGLLHRERATASALAIEDVDALFLPAERFDAVIADRPALRRHLSGLSRARLERLARPPASPDDETATDQIVLV
jgi:CRP-like cAMP-binding protein